MADMPGFVILHCKKMARINASHPSTTQKQPRGYHSTTCSPNIFSFQKKNTRSRLAREVVRNLILVPGRLSRLRLHLRPADGIRHSLGRSLLQPLGIVSPDLLTPNPVLGLLLILAVPEAEWVIVALANGARVDGRQWLPLALLAGGGIVVAGARLG
jgi:hypothetical protein